MSIFRDANRVGPGVEMIAGFLNFVPIIRSSKNPGGVYAKNIFVCRLPGVEQLCFVKQGLGCMSQYVANCIGKTGLMLGSFYNNNML